MGTCTSKLPTVEPEQQKGTPGPAHGQRSNASDYTQQQQREPERTNAAESMLQHLSLEVYLPAFELAGFTTWQQLLCLSDWDLCTIEQRSHVPILPAHRDTLLCLDTNAWVQARVSAQHSRAGSLQPQQEDDTCPPPERCPASHAAAASPANPGALASRLSTPESLTHLPGALGQAPGSVSGDAGERPEGLAAAMVAARPLHSSTSGSTAADPSTWDTTDHAQEQQHQQEDGHDSSQAEGQPQQKVDMAPLSAGRANLDSASSTELRPSKAHTVVLQRLQRVRDQLTRQDKTIAHVAGAAGAGSIHRDTGATTTTTAAAEAGAGALREMPPLTKALYEAAGVAPRAWPSNLDSPEAASTALLLGGAGPLTRGQPAPGGAATIVLPPQPSAASVCSPREQAALELLGWAPPTRLGSSCGSAVLELPAAPSATPRSIRPASAATAGAGNVHRHGGMGGGPVAAAGDKVAQTAAASGVVLSSARCSNDTADRRFRRRPPSPAASATAVGAATGQDTQLAAADGNGIPAGQQQGAAGSEAAQELLYIVARAKARLAAKMAASQAVAAAGVQGLGPGSSRPGSAVGSTRAATARMQAAAAAGGALGGGNEQQVLAAVGGGGAAGGGGGMLPAGVAVQGSSAAGAAVPPRVGGWFGGDVLQSDKRNPGDAPIGSWVGPADNSSLTTTQELGSTATAAVVAAGADCVDELRGAAAGGAGRAGRSSRSSFSNSAQPHPASSLHRPPSSSSCTSSRSPTAAAAVAAAASSFRSKLVAVPHAPGAAVMCDFELVEELQEVLLPGQVLTKDVPHLSVLGSDSVAEQILPPPGVAAVVEGCSAAHHPQQLGAAAAVEGPQAGMVVVQGPGVPPAGLFDPGNGVAQQALFQVSPQQHYQQQQQPAAEQYHRPDSCDAAVEWAPAAAAAAAAHLPGLAQSAAGQLGATDNTTTAAAATAAAASSWAPSSVVAAHSSRPLATADPQQQLLPPEVGVWAHELPQGNTAGNLHHTPHQQVEQQQQLLQVPRVDPTGEAAATEAQQSLSSNQAPHLQVAAADAGWEQSAVVQQTASRSWQTQQQQQQQQQQQPAEFDSRLEDAGEHTPVAALQPPQQQLGQGLQLQLQLLQDSAGEGGQGWVDSSGGATATAADADGRIDGVRYSRLGGGADDVVQPYRLRRLQQQQSHAPGGRQASADAADAQDDRAQLSDAEPAPAAAATPAAGGKLVRPGSASGPRKQGRARSDQSAPVSTPGTGKANTFDVRKAMQQAAGDGAAGGVGGVKEVLPTVRARQKRLQGSARLQQPVFRF